MCTDLSSVASQHYSRIGVENWGEKSCMTGKTLILGLLLVQFCLEFAAEATDWGIFWMENKHLLGAEVDVACQDLSIKNEGKMKKDIRKQ